MMLEKYIAGTSIKVVGNGDAIQLDPIEANFNICIAPEKYYTPITDAMFPDQIRLRVLWQEGKPIKRFNEADSIKVKELKKDLFGDHQLSMNDIWTKYAKPISMNDVPLDSKCISYLNETRLNVNEHIHNKLYPSRPRYFAGLIVKAKTRIGKGTSKIHVNYEYEIQSIDDMDVTLKDIETETLTTLKKGCLDTCFSLPYANTCHSVQGRSYHEPVVIFDSGFRHVNRKWAYVALTRNRTMNVSVCNDRTKMSLSTSRLLDMICGYKQQDIQAGRLWKTDYISASWIKQQSERQRHQCFGCGEVMNYINTYGDNLNMTVDRIDNAKAHLKSNCCLMCFKCNIAKH
jgi:hypothetical protein